MCRSKHSKVGAGTLVPPLRTDCYPRRRYGTLPNFNPHSRGGIKIGISIARMGRYCRLQGISKRQVVWHHLRLPYLEGGTHLGDRTPENHTQGHLRYASSLVQSLRHKRARRTPADTKPKSSQRLAVQDVRGTLPSTQSSITPPTKPTPNETELVRQLLPLSRSAPPCAAANLH